ncbi:MAG: hypothetical protein GKR91_06195 [Pseudomonadales bacterium]|nr:hypothetical protein [Pseudomonadales bacterium]
MRKLIASILIIVVCSLGISPSLTAAETETVADIWGCSFLPGKDMQDLEGWRDYYQTQLEELGSAGESLQAFMWTPRFAGAEVDFVWFEYQANLNVSARFSEAYDSSGIGSVVDGMWESIVDCQHNQNFRRQIYTGANFNVTPPVVVESFRCVFHPGKGFADVEEALIAWSRVLDGLPQSDRFIAYMFTPFHAALGFDVSFYGVYDSITDYGSLTTDYLTSDSGQQMQAHWLSIQRCESRLWNARAMI